MQTIKTEHGTYTISDTRDAGEFLRQLAKPKKRARREKDSVRHFPKFYPGETSVRDYVRQYFELNGWTNVYELFPNLPYTPAQCYDPTQLLCEVSTNE
jgi:hypothetical protein